MVNFWIKLITGRYYSSITLNSSASKMSIWNTIIENQNQHYSSQWTVKLHSYIPVQLPVYGFTHKGSLWYVCTYNEPAVDVPQHRVRETHREGHLFERVYSCPIFENQYHKTCLFQRNHWMQLKKSHLFFFGNWFLLHLNCDHKIHMIISKHLSYRNLNIKLQ